MNYKELQNIEEAFYTFLRKIKTKKQIKVEYYKFYGIRANIDFAFIGYETAKGGVHGIHYNGQKHAFSFGTREIEGKSWIIGLTAEQERNIPGHIKETFKEVANFKKDKVIQSKI